MGYHDVYRSHQPEIIYWGSFLSYLYRSFTELRTETSAEQTGLLDSNDKEGRKTVTISDNSDKEPDQQDADNQKNDEERVTLSFNESGVIYRRSQVDDYIYRGALASSYNVLDYFVETYERTTNRLLQDSLVSQALSEFSNTSENIQSSNQTNKGGRPAHLKIQYMPPHPRSRTHARVVRPSTHNHMPNIIGLARFPRKSDPTQADIYAACILIFLKPWRCPADIKSPEQTWTDALNDFLMTANERTLDIIDNLEHKHDAQAAAENKLQASLDLEDMHVGGDMMELDEPEPEVDSTYPNMPGSYEITQEMLERAELEAENHREVVHGVQAVRIGEHSGVFGSQQMPIRACDERVTNSEAQMLKSWLQLMKQDVVDTNSLHNSAGAQPTNPNDIGTVEPIRTDQSIDYYSDNIEPTVQAYNEPLPPIPDEALLPDQQRVVGIVRRHLTQTLHALDHDPSQMPAQLRLLLIGEGGTGKSRVIQTISNEFKRRGVEYMLVKGAYTGCAASNIEGQTTHSLARIFVGKKSDAKSNALKQELVQAWQPVRYLIIDEYSMLSKEFLAQLSRIISIAKIGRNFDNGDCSFGGINVILCGDGHQIPPVAVAAGGALHQPATSSRYITTSEAGIGRVIYEKFDTVVILKHQVRVTDPIWQRFLSNFRIGQVKDSDVALLDSVTLTNSKCRPTDFSSEQWRDCILITPRNSVQTRWNAKSVEEHCRRTGEQLLIFKAQDTCRDQGVRRPITPSEKYFSMKTCKKSPNARKGRKEKNGLPDEVRIAIGLKVMVTANLNTDIDITNGARGVIVGIKLDPLEPAFSPLEPQVTLTKLPAYILVKLDRTRAKVLPGLEAGVVPVVPSVGGYTIIVPIVQDDGQVTSVRRYIKRVQFPIAPAYAFTDYRAQGQTLKSAIVDIAEPPTGPILKQPNVYVALSRCSGLNNIRILRDFDRAILRKPIDIDLVRDDERLERLNILTKKWWDESNNANNDAQGGLRMG